MIDVHEQVQVFKLRFPPHKRTALAQRLCGLVKVCRFWFRTETAFWVNMVRQPDFPCSRSICQDDSWLAGWNQNSERDKGAMELLEQISHRHDIILPLTPHYFLQSYSGTSDMTTKKLEETSHGTRPIGRIRSGNSVNSS